MILLGTFFVSALLDGQRNPVALVWQMFKVMLPLLAACLLFAL